MGGWALGQHTAYQNTTSVRYTTSVRHTTLEHRARRGLGGGRHVMVGWTLSQHMDCVCRCAAPDTWSIAALYWKALHPDAAVDSATHCCAHT